MIGGSDILGGAGGFGTWGGFSGIGGGGGMISIGNPIGGIGSFGPGIIGDVGSSFLGSGIGPLGNPDFSGLNRQGSQSAWTNSAGGLRSRDQSQTYDTSTGLDSVGRYAGNDSQQGSHWLNLGQFLRSEGGNEQTRGMGMGPYRTPTAEMFDDPYWMELDSTGTAQRLYAYILGAELDPGLEYQLSAPEGDPRTQGNGYMTSQVHGMSGALDPLLGGALLNDELLDPFEFAQQFDARAIEAGDYGGWVPNAAYTEPQLQQIHAATASGEYASAEDAFYGINQQGISTVADFRTDTEPTSVNNQVPYGDYLGSPTYTERPQEPNFEHADTSIQQYEETSTGGAPGLKARHGNRPKKDLSGRLITQSRQDLHTKKGRRGTRKADDSLLEYFGGSLLGGGA